MPANIGWRRQADWILNWLLLVILVYFLTTSWAPLPMKAMLMHQALGLIMLGYLLFPGWNNANSIRRNVLIWGVLLALATLSFALCDKLSLFLACKAALAVLLLNPCMLSLTYALSARGFDTRLLGWLIFWSALLVTALPIWMSPWVEAIADTPARLNMLLWSSPLSYLAAMVDYDYVRSEWFYRHTLYGMYRYDYPNTCWYSLGLAGIFLLLFRFTPDKLQRRRER